MAAVFGPALEVKGYGGASLLLPLVFTLILITVLAHGLSIGWLSRLLDLSARNANGVLIVGASPWTIGLAQALKDKEVPVMIVDSVWHRLRAVRLAGVKVYYGQILSEASEQELEFSDYGYLFAATDNDAYNALVCSYFAAEIGRHRVFQLPDTSVEEPDPKRLPRTVRGLIMPGERAWFEELMSNWYRGWTFQKTLLTEEFGFERFQTACPEGALPVAVVKADGKVQLSSPEQPIKPKPADVVIWFGAKQEKAKPAKAAGTEEPPDRDKAVGKT